MADRGTSSELVGTLALVRTRIDKFRNVNSFNEQSTKTSLIIPILAGVAMWMLLKDGY